MLTDPIVSNRREVRKAMAAFDRAVAIRDVAAAMCLGDRARELMDAGRHLAPRTAAGAAEMLREAAICASCSFDPTVENFERQARRLAKRVGAGKITTRDLIELRQMLLAAARIDDEERQLLPIEYQAADDAPLTEILTAVIDWARTPRLVAATD